MIEDTGRVVSIKGDKAMVEVEPASAYAKCAFRDLEEQIAGGRPVLEALNIVKAVVGDRVKVRVESVAYLKASAAVYGIPLLLLIIGTIFGAYISVKFNMSSDTMGALFGIAGLIIGVLTLFLFRKRGEKKEY